ncbi:hypothetical protein DL764_006758 [Monosporascus ibericus]|uniref:2EXR domain-containing protein n=1 Tax=Monosporascus ibericus TaxID=155417 RepID=A0A4Q4T685_9PEZI|nr:hypothetical protein DL764_006758 [Monosporascus ibericus]
MAAEFTLFNKLLAEIRMLIWEATLPRRYILFNPYCYSTVILGPPAIAQVCRESRALALKNVSPRSLQTVLVDGLTWYDSSRDSVFWGIRYSSDFVPLARTEPYPRPLPVSAITSIMYEDRDFNTSFENHQAYAKQLARILSHEWIGSQNIGVVNLVLYNKRIPDQTYWEPKIIDTVFGVDMIRFADLRDEREVESHQSDTAREQPASPYEESLSNLKHWDVLMRDFKYQWLIDRYEHDHETDSSAIRLYHGQPIDEANSWVKKTIAKMPEIRPVFVFRKEGTRVSYPRKMPVVSWNGQAWERTQ